jgi:hypothetical protein
MNLTAYPSSDQQIDQLLWLIHQGLTQAQIPKEPKLYKYFLSICSNLNVVQQKSQ